MKRVLALFMFLLVFFQCFFQYSHAHGYGHRHRQTRVHTNTLKSRLRDETNRERPRSVIDAAAAQRNFVHLSPLIAPTTSATAPTFALFLALLHARSDAEARVTVKR